MNKDFFFQCLTHQTKANEFFFLVKTFPQSPLLLSAGVSHLGLVIAYDCKPNKLLHKHLCIKAFTIVSV